MTELEKARCHCGRSVRWFPRDEKQWLCNVQDDDAYWQRADGEECPCCHEVLAATGPPNVKLKEAGLIPEGEELIEWAVAQGKARGIYSDPNSLVASVLAQEVERLRKPVPPGELAEAVERLEDLATNLLQFVDSLEPKTAAREHDALEDVAAIRTVCNALRQQQGDLASYQQATRQLLDAAHEEAEEAHSCVPDPPLGGPAAPVTTCVCSRPTPEADPALVEEFRHSTTGHLRVSLRNKQGEEDRQGLRRREILTIRKVLAEREGEKTDRNAD